MSGSNVLIRYTYSGDANLDGKVNALDFNALASNYGNTSGKFWNQGDFNYDGFTNTLDFNSLAANFNEVLAAPLPANGVGLIVPEPVGLAMLAMAGATRFRRRRR